MLNFFAHKELSRSWSIDDENRDICKEIGCNINWLFSVNVEKCEGEF